MKTLDNLHNFSTEESLYIKILIWAYEKQDIGFSFTELTEKFKLSNDQRKWVVKVFLPSSQVADNLFDFIDSDNNDTRYVVTSKGTSAAVEYLNLKETKRSAKRAENIALVAITIGIIVGILQIVVGILQIIC